MLTCPTCTKEYTTSGAQQPRLLVSCGHTFCQQCLDARKNEEEHIECPQCSLVNKEPHAPNIVIMNFIDSKVKNPNQTVRPVPALQQAMCQVCQDKAATLICFHCLQTGFRFCDVCSEKEHSRPFAPVMGHKPRSISSVKYNTPVPTCPIHSMPCLFFSFKENKFICDKCKPDIQEDDYMPIEDAVTEVRKQLPSLLQLLRDRVNNISRMRAELGDLVTRVDEQRERSKDRVKVEFNQFELALKKRQGLVLNKIDEQAVIQRKALEEQLEKLEVVQGAADTCVVQGNMLLQMSEYSRLHQAQLTLDRIQSQLADEDVLPLFSGPVTQGEILVHISPAFLDEIDRLGTIGGGCVPTRPICMVDCGLVLFKWEQEDPAVKEHQVQYEPVEDTDFDIITSSQYLKFREKFPKVVDVKNTTEKRIDGLMPDKRYVFRVRALNPAGWGIWSLPIIYRSPNFPLLVGFTEEIVMVQIPFDGLYGIVARGAKAEDGDIRKGGRGAIVEAKFYLSKYDNLIILCGGMSTKVGSGTGGGGGTFVALNRNRDLLIVAGGGGGTRGQDQDDHNGRDANIESPDGTDGVGTEWAPGGADGEAGKDAEFGGSSWGCGGAGYNTSSSTANSFLHGGVSKGGFGGGGAVGVGGGEGAGTREEEEGGVEGEGGCFVKEGGLDQKLSLGNDGHGSVEIVWVDVD